MPERTYRLLGPDGRIVESAIPGTFGGHRVSRVYGRLDCPTALAAIARGGPYPRHRVFFADEATARAAGFRPCARCLPEAYRAWRPADGRRRSSPREAGSSAHTTPEHDP